MRLGGLAEPGRGLRRIENGFSEGALTFDRKTDDFGFFDCALGSLLGCRDNEIADAAPLNLGRPLDDCQRIWGDARLDAGGADRRLGHDTASLFGRFQTYGGSPDM